MSRLSVLILDDWEGIVARSEGVERMRSLAEVRVLVEPLDTLSDEELSGVEVIMAIRERTALDAAILARFPMLKLILQTGGHAYHLDGQAAASRGIAVALGRRAVGPRAAVPELTFALMVAALRHLPAAHQSMRDGRWQPFLGRTLSGRTLGILGYGRHGRNVARIGRAYGMDVVAWRRDEQQEDDDVLRLDLDDLLAASDVVSIHLKLSAQSMGLIDAGRLASMREGSVLINTSRGAIVDEAALCTALASGALSAAGLDVFSEEPLPADSPLRSLPNVVMTPHLGWTVEEVLTEFAQIAADQLAGFLEGTLGADELLTPEVGGSTSAAGGTRRQ